MWYVAVVIMVMNPTGQTTPDTLNTHTTTLLQGNEPKNNGVFVNMKLSTKIHFLTWNLNDSILHKTTTTTPGEIFCFTIFKNQE